MRRHASIRNALLLAWLLILGLTGPARAAARLEAQGSTLARRRLETLLAPALRAPGDSTALVGSVAALLGELEGEGFLGARASAAWDSSGAPVLRLSVAQGERVRLASLRIETAVPADSARFAGSLDLTTGGWASPAAVAEAVERAVREAVDHGHPYASLGVSAFRWDSGGAQVRLNGALGPLVTVTRVRLDGLHATRPGLAARSMGRLKGEPFSQAAAIAARDRLARLGLFRSVEYRGVESDGDWRRGQIVYQVEEPRYNRFEGAVGVQSGGRAVGLADLALDNLAGTGRALALRWQSRGRGAVEFGARYAEPLLLGAPLKAQVTLEQQDQDTLYSRTRWGGQLTFTVSERRRIAAGYTQERVVQSSGEVQRSDQQITDFTLERDQRDRPDAPRRGSFARVTAAEIFTRETLRSSGRRSRRAGTAQGLGEWHWRTGARTGLSLELSGAARFSERRVPLFERYAVGGAASLRGQDEQAFRVDRYALSRFEWRWFLGEHGERVFLFWDHAVMGTRLSLALGGDHMAVRQRDGVGFGLRLPAAGGTVGVDYGLEPGRAPLDGKIHLRLISAF